MKQLSCLESVWRRSVFCGFLAMVLFGADAVPQAAAPGAAPTADHVVSLEGWPAEGIAAKVEAPFEAVFRGDFGGVPVLDVTGNYDKTVDGTLNAEARFAVAQELYRHHADDYDFLVFFTTFEFDTGGAAGFYLRARNEVDGIGSALFDQSQLFGSAGRLLGTIDMAALGGWGAQPLDPGFEGALVTLTHEMLHQWCCYTAAEDGALLGVDGSHWSYLLDTDASVMYGSDWRETSDGSFTARAVERFYSPLDLYLAGFFDETEVAPFVLIENPAVDPAQLPSAGATVSGVARTVTIDDVVAHEGPRVPAAASAQRDFRAAFVLLKRPEDPLFNEDVVVLDRLRRELANRFSILTGGRATLRVLPPAVSQGQPGEPTTGGGGGVRPPGDFELADALAWLRGRQDAEGSWQDHPGTRLRDTTAAADTLVRLDLEFTRSPDVLAWLEQREEVTTDYLARAATALPLLGGDPAAARSELATRQNADGGWGADVDHASDPLDTALALSAAAGALDAAAVDAAVQYLHATQGADGGWSSVPGSPSRSAVTTTVLRTLAELGRGEPVTPAAVAWLTSKQNATDGGFGDSPSTVHDTAGVLETLAVLGFAGAIDRDAAEDYLSSRQGVDGSWDASVYATARAAAALTSSTLPDLAFEGPVTAEPAQPRDGETVDLRATVINSGGQPTGASVARLYEGLPESSPAVAEVAIPPLVAGQSVVVIPGWDTTGHPGTQLLSLRIDADGTVAEIDEDNNLATVEVEVLEAPPGADLAVSSSELLISPATPSLLPAELAISSVVRNVGQSDAEQVVVRLWLEAPETGLLLAEQTVPLLAGRGSTVANFTHTLTTGGSQTFWIAASSDTAEDDLANNFAQVTVVPTPSLDLEITDGDVTVSEDPVALGSNATFDVTLRNRGTVDAPPVDVAFVLGDGVTSEQLDRRTLTLAAGEEIQQSVGWSADRVGELTFSATADADAMVFEIDESNNQGAVTFTVSEITDPNLRLTLETPPASVGDGERLELRVTVDSDGGVASPASRVRLYDGDPATGTPVAEAEVPALAVGQSTTLPLEWDTFGQAGSHLLSAVVDPDALIAEVTEGDNTASATVEVAPPTSGVDLETTAGSLLLSPTRPARLPETVSVTLGLRNLGLDPATQARVVVRDGAPGTGAPVFDQRLDVPARSDASLQRAGGAAPGRSQGVDHGIGGSGQDPARPCRRRSGARSGAAGLRRHGHPRRQPSRGQRPPRPGARPAGRRHGRLGQPQPRRLVAADLDPRRPRPGRQRDLDGDPRGAGGDRHRGGRHRDPGGGVGARGPAGLPRRRRGERSDGGRDRHLRRAAERQWPGHRRRNLAGRRRDRHRDRQGPGRGAAARLRVLGPAQLRPGRVRAPGSAAPRGPRAGGPGRDPGR